MYEAPEQPVYATAEEEAAALDAYDEEGYVSDEVGDMQKIGMGIALYHFVRGLEEEGVKYPYLG